MYYKGEDGRTYVVATSLMGPMILSVPFLQENPCALCGEEAEDGHVCNKCKEENK